MPDLRDRRQHEEELQAALAAILLLMAEDARRNPRSIPWDSLASQLAARIAPSLAKTHAEAALQFARRTGQSSDGIEADARQWASAYASALATEIVSSTRDQLISAVERATNDEELAAGLLLIFGHGRAGTIGVTETTRAITAGEGAALRRFQSETGQTVRLLWKTEGDGRVCEICGPLESQRPEVYGTVSPGGPPAHPRCRCWLEYEFREIRSAA